MWGRWRDPWPKKDVEFFDETEKGLYALLEPRRLLDILAHFIVFETRDGKTTKKVCRYQQFRAANKMYDRVLERDHAAGLIWHTQGSGKSLTMIFAALKIKFHHGLEDDRIQNPNLLVVTDRIDLHEQISATFAACGFKNCRPIHHMRRRRDNDGNPIFEKPGTEPVYYLEEELSDHAVGKVLLSTVFKFESNDPRLESPEKPLRQAALRDMAVAGSENWVLLVDECHRTQEKDLGAYLRAVLPNAVRFGFTGTPVKKKDYDTFKNFGAPGERYLDKYGIDDAIRDGATLPIYYQGRMTEWHLYAKEIDILFEQWFSNEPEGKVTEIKNRGVTKGDLARFEPRIHLIATDIWAHYRQFVKPDGFKAQIVAIDRRSCAAYKHALDRVIARNLQKTEHLESEKALARASAMSVCIFSPGQHDKKDHPELAALQLTDVEIKKARVRFVEDPGNPVFLIVCNKLLTGFDAPVEQAMYLDNPLTDHNLLQAIARTNRRFGKTKDHGLIVDYIGVSKKLADALAAYHREDVDHAMLNLDLKAEDLRVAHREVMAMLKGVERTDDPKENVKAATKHLATEDRWYLFRAKAATFLKAYAALSPDSRVLLYTADLKWIASIIPYGKLRFEKIEEVDWRGYSEKIREMLNEHLDVTGLKMVCKLRRLDEPEFWKEFENPEDLETAAVRKLAELKKETTERTKKNEARYEKFSERIQELIEEFNAGLLTAEELLEATQGVAHEMRPEDEAFRKSGLNERAYGVCRILEKFLPKSDRGQKVAEEVSTYDPEHSDPPELTPLQRVALEIDVVYASEESAPPYWQDKNQLRKELRGRVRRLVRPLGLEHWQDRVPGDVEHFAIRHYAKP